MSARLLIVLSSIASAAGCASTGGSGRALPDRQPIDVFLVAHPDDWQLFMGDRVLPIVRSGNPTTFVYLSAGGANRVGDYWRAREQGALASTRFAFGQWPALSHAAPTCNSVEIGSHTIQRCSVATSTAYFLRLPDGNLQGQGFPRTQLQSLRKLMRDSLGSIEAVDSSTMYRDWADLASTVATIIRGAARTDIRLHSMDPDTVANPGDHSDHYVAGLLADSLARAGGWTLTLYTGYAIQSKPENLSSESFAAKAGLFMAYDSRRLAGDSTWSAYARFPRMYSAFLTRTYTRSEPLHSSASRR